MEKRYVKVLLKLSNKANRSNEVPVAAIIVYHNKIIGKGYNQREKNNLTISHAEIEAINQANKWMGDWRLNNCTMYVTMKPCDMCEKVIKEARIDRVYYLVERDVHKHQYNKTEFVKSSRQDSDEYVVKYKEKLAQFWKNKR